jgi:hypothetical protein
MEYKCGAWQLDLNAALAAHALQPRAVNFHVVNRLWQQQLLSDGGLARLLTRALSQLNGL